MPDPVGNSSRFDPARDWCTADFEDPPLEPATENGPDATPATPAGPVFSVGLAVSAESVFPSVASPVTGLPGGAAVAVGIYFDVGRLEIGSYRRVEARWSAGSFAGGGVEVGITDSRSSFDGESASVFAEGGTLGKLGFSASATGASVGLGVGEGVAAGLAMGETTTEPAIELDRLLEWDSFPLRRGP